MGQFNTGGSFPSHLQPTQGKTLYAGNYLDFASGAVGTAGANQWAQQFLPDVYEKEVERYGNRTISSFLRMVSAEMPSTSDQIIWTEQGRLHTRYVNVIREGTSSTFGTLPTGAAPTAGGATGVNANGGAVLNFYVPTAQPGDLGSTSTTEGGTACNFRAGQTIMIQEQGSEANRGGTGDTLKGIVNVVSGQRFQVTLYTPHGAFTTASRFTALVYGSEFAKGTGNFTEKLDPSYSTYSTSPIIMKEHYAINGSDTSQIGWIEVTSENGANGYLWYMKSEHENRLRWEDYIEMSMVEGVQALNQTQNTLGAFRGDFRTNDSSVSQAPTTARGTEGFFAALEDRGNVYQGFGDEATGGGALTDFDAVLRQLDKQGAIEENMIYLNRDLSLQIDDILSQQNSYGAGGTSWGVFNQSEKMALTLGFSGFRRGSYDFYKTDWKYLNDWSTRGGFGDIEGVMIPAGTSTVYDQNLGQNIKRPFLHVRYRSSEADNRKMKSWITGSVGGAYTTDVDEMRIHYLTERCLVTQAANNFVLFKA